MSKIEVNTIEPQSGTTVTLGASGDTLSVPSGATLNAVGFKRTYNTASSATTATVNQSYFCDTSSAAFTLTLPASPSAGDEVNIIDISGTFDTNNLTVGRNSEKIMGLSEDLTVATERAAFTLVYSGSTNGWVYTQK